MSRSSILSFESLRGFRLRIPWTPLAVLAGLALIELTVRAIPEKTLMPVLSRQGEIFFMEEQVLPRFPAPQIIFLGSSRIRRALVPRQFDEEAHLPPNSTANLGLAMARVYESLYLYERNETQLRSARVVVLNVDEWHLSTGPKMSNSLYEIDGPLLERLRFPPAQRSRLLLDGLFTFRLKAKLLPGMFFGRRKDHQTLKVDENNQVLPEATREKLGSYADQAALFYEKFGVDEVLKDHVRRLARRVQANGGKFVLLQLPNRAAYQAEVARTHRKEYDAQRAAFSQLAAELNAPFYAFERPDEVGLTDEDYEDYGHLKPAGAKKVTHFLAGVIHP